MKEVYKFSCQTGMTKPNFHVIDRLDWFFIDKENKVSIPSTEAILTEKVKILNKNNMFTDFWSREPYILVAVSQQGYKVGNYRARIIIKLGGTRLTRIDTFIEPGPLFFEAAGKVMDTNDIIEEGLNFIGGEKKAAPKVIVRSIISTRDPGYRPNEARGLFVTGKM